MAMEFEKSLQYLYALQSHGIKPGLSRTEALPGVLGSPHRSFRVFHVAGTNGKGSTAAMTASMLAKQGYRVGLYTSPHLIDFTERIQVNGAPISHDRVAGAHYSPVRRNNTAGMAARRQPQHSWADVAGSAALPCWRRRQ